MNRFIVLTLLYICASAAPSYGRQEKALFSERLYASYDRAMELNESKDYYKAFMAFSAVCREMDATLEDKHIEPSALDEGLFQEYWGAKKSIAETAYKLGNYSVMASVSTALRGVLEQRDQIDPYRQNDCLSDLAKIEGDYYYLTEQFDSAEVALREAVTLRREWLEYEFDFYCAIYGDLAQLYYRKGDYAASLAQLDTILMHSGFKADARAAEYYDIRERQREVNSQRAICLARLGRYDEAQMTIDPIIEDYQTHEDMRAYAEALRKKAKILMLQYDATGKYDPEVIAYYETYLNISRDFIDQNFTRMTESERERYWMAEQPFVADCYRLEDKAPSLLYDVALYSKAVLLQMGREFKDEMTEEQRQQVLSGMHVDWHQVRDALPAAGCAIEFVVYEKRGENHIGAIVLRKDADGPRFVDVGRMSSISDFSLAKAYRVKDVLKGSVRNQVNDLYNNEVLRSMCWNEMLVEAIGESEDIYFSPDGIFHQIGIEYMTPSSLENKRFHRLTTTRILTLPRQKLRTDRMLICGDVNYESSVEDHGMSNDGLAYSLMSSMGFSLEALESSAAEIDSVWAIRMNHHKDFLLRADSVTETALNQLLSKYHVLLISTHGMFSEMSKMGTDIQPAIADVQLSSSCLFLSGSEKNMRNDRFEVSQHDGILSAREVANMNLENVDLTVMSACMSGLGYVTPDGVYGLQRGLKTAGVKAIISSLWSVDDEATCMFIRHFYMNLENGQSVHEAFSAARVALKKHTRYFGTPPNVVARSKFNFPYFYNAFILIDGVE